MNDKSLKNITKDAVILFFSNISKYSLLLLLFWSGILLSSFIIEVALEKLLYKFYLHDNFYGIVETIKVNQLKAYSRLLFQALLFPIFGFLFARKTLLLMGFTLSKYIPATQLIWMSVAMGLFSIITILVEVNISSYFVPGIIGIIIILPLRLSWICVLLVTCSVLASKKYSFSSAVILSSRFTVKKWLSLLRLSIIAVLASASGIVAVGIGLILTATLIFVIFPFYIGRKYPELLLNNPHGTFVEEAKKSLSNTPSYTENKIYQQIGEELQNGIKHAGPYAKSIAESNGDTSLAESLYVKYRYASILEEANNTNNKIVTISPCELPPKSQNKEQKSAKNKIIALLFVLMIIGASIVLLLPGRDLFSTYNKSVGQNGISLHSHSNMPGHNDNIYGEHLSTEGTQQVKVVQEINSVISVKPVLVELMLNDGSIYKGPVLDGIPHGIGYTIREKIVNTNTMSIWYDHFYGEFANGYRSGYGVYSNSSKASGIGYTIYAGMWSNNLYHGTGILYDISSAMYPKYYAGRFEMGQKSGDGVLYTLVSNEHEFVNYRLEGDWTGDGVNGYGKLIDHVITAQYESEKLYTGNFIDGKYSGRGVYIEKLSESSSWGQESNRFIVSEIKYDGDWVQGQKAGYGRMDSSILVIKTNVSPHVLIQKSIEVKHGNWVDDKPNGKFYWSSKREYFSAQDQDIDKSVSYLTIAGEFHDGLPHGQAEEASDSETYKGGYLNGLRSGYGELTRSSGIYRGYWREGKKHGQGKYYLSDKWYYAGNWLEGEAIGMFDEYEDGNFVRSFRATDRYIP